MTFWLLCHIGERVLARRGPGRAGRDPLEGAGGIGDRDDQGVGDTAGVFDKLMVIPGSMAVLVFGLLVAFTGPGASGTTAGSWRRSSSTCR